ncbi:acyltransferase family protein [Actinomycetospora cinnamomea]|uniref:Peptidoglycan/LPS O-acetylase OafA/YrhL n=1 Tax=Actinomycetospora cinnamomea TaxID=663609 RepID=A0A2U1FBI8_9PSEU|nr:acyltransferase family protein [Actinomycetospora cinnamomea]PVZ09538.1 peptidoglycan/LPS O-acetylase OafA/YrhL [Actinomycetospora cinnamomea]
MAASETSTVSASSTAGRRPTEAAPAPRGFRPELQGLRALAVALVVVYHVWVGRVSGGVDVFFVISGFLLAGQMTRAVGRGRIDVLAYWGKTAKRLLAPTCIVLCGVVLASLAILPHSRWPQTLREVVASALFLQNWQLAADSVDYYAANNTASVVQHMWSLSIQGQFYLLFPLMIVLVALVARRVGAEVREAVTVGLIALTAASLAYSVVLTTTDQQLAYFHSATRLWEFTLGGLLAVVGAKMTLPRWWAIATGWIGVLGLVLCGVVLDVQGGFPGYLALWPVLCALAVLVAGDTRHRLGADRVLSSSVMQYLGNISFPLYLWHWPVLLFALAVTRQPELGLEGGLVVIVLSVLLAVLTRHLVEVPLSAVSFGRSPRWGSHRVAVVLLVPVLALALGWQGLIGLDQRAATDVGQPQHRGAMSLADGQPGDDTTPIPSFTALSADWEPAPPHCRLSVYEPTMQVCASSVDGEPVRRLLLVGDSHIQQFTAALLPYAESEGWQVMTILKGACPFALGHSEGEATGCQEWNEQALQEVRDLQPDAVVTIASREVSPGLIENTPASYVEGWRALDALGIPVLGVRDNPRFDYSPAACVEGQLPPDFPCTPPRATLYPDVPSYERAGAIPGNVSFLDLSDFVCTADVCPPVIGGVFVYLDNNHLTATYARSMSPLVGPEIARLMGW